jgi:hypothetical protein
MGWPGVRVTRPDFAKRIANERAAGSTWQAIADRLNEERVPTVRGSAFWCVGRSKCCRLRPPPAGRKGSMLAVLPLRRRRARLLPR